VVFDTGDARPRAFADGVFSERVSERRETYQATFAVKGGDRDEYLTGLDQATWRKLRVGRRCRLKIGAFGGEVKQVTTL
jgi:hypothetical protein